MESKLQEKLKELESEAVDYRYYGVRSNDIGYIVCKAKIELLKELLGD